MAVRSDFNVIPFKEHLGDKKGDLDTDFTWKGKFSSVKSFRIEGKPVDDAFLLINHKDVHNSSHVIRINNVNLPWLDIIDADGKYVTQMKLIPPGVLFQGNNTIQIEQKGDDNFIIYEIVVHLREED